jgi:hypothetical protein
MEASPEVQMADYTYPYHDIDTGHHKRQRVGPADQHLWIPNEGLMTDLPPQQAYDPVRDIGQSDTNFIDSGFFSFVDSLWLPGPSTDTFHPSYNFEEDNFLQTSQSFCEQTTAPFAINFPDGFNEPDPISLQTPTETNDHDFVPSLEVVASPPEVASVICFGMVCSAQLSVRSHGLTSYYRLQTFLLIVIKQALF